MKRIKVEAVFHVGDGENEQTFADRIINHMTGFKSQGTSANARGPHYETCLVSVERKTWDKVK